MKGLRSSFLLLLSAYLTACAMASGGSAGRSSNVIAEGELRNLRTGLSAMEVVERLRPRWLGRQSQTLQGSDVVRVVVDGLSHGEVQLLRDLRADDIAEMRYLPARDATTRYGIGFPAGVIEVVTRNTVGG